MSTKWTIRILMGMFLCAFVFQWWKPVSKLRLACQQDAIRDEWIRSNAEATTKYAYLTFDDGPSENTDEILEILKKENIKATFFVVGCDTKEGKRKYKKIYKEGHTLGMHSYCHEYDQIYCSVDAFAKDIKKLDRLLYKTVGVHPTAFRFPGGSSNSIVGNIKPYIAWVRKQGYEYYDWNAVSGDALNYQTSAETLNNNILKDVNGQCEVIILMHDLTKAHHTVEALPELIKELRNRGYQFKAIDENTKAIHHIS